MASSYCRCSFLGVPLSVASAFRSGLYEDLLGVTSSAAVVLQKSSFRPQLAPLCATPERAAFPGADAESGGPLPRVWNGSRKNPCCGSRSSNVRWVSCVVACYGKAVLSLSALHSQFHESSFLWCRVAEMSNIVSFPQVFLRVMCAFARLTTLRWLPSEMLDNGQMLMRLSCRSRGLHSSMRRQ